MFSNAQSFYVKMSIFAKSGWVCEYFLFGPLHFSECLKCILIKGKESPAALTTDSGQKNVSVPSTLLYLGSRWLREQGTLDFIVFLLGCIPLFWILLKLMMQEPYFFPSRPGTLTLINEFHLPETQWWAGGFISDNCFFSLCLAADRIFLSGWNYS